MIFSRNTICIWLATVLLPMAPVFAKQAAFCGTWKLDIEVLAKQMAETYGESDQSERIVMRLGRMKSMRFILNETEGVMVREGIPNRIGWVCKPNGDAKFDFINSVDSAGAERIAIEMTGDDRMNFLMHSVTPGGEQTTVFPLVRESTVDTWDPPPVFTIGMPAPPVVTEKWLQDPARVIDFADGRVYLIEFWATWCGPCLQKMPRLVELQQKFGQDALAIVAITSESPDEVLRFIEQPRQQEANADNPIGQRILEMSKTISIGIDKDTTTFRSYMVASEFRAIPSMFIVGKTGLIEWGGSGDEGESVLQQVLDGSWNRDEFAKRFVGIRRAYTELPRVQDMLRAGKREEAELLINELEAIADEPVKFQLERIKSSLQDAKEKR